MGGWDIIRGRERKEGLATKEFEGWRVGRRYTKQIFYLTLLYLCGCRSYLCSCLVTSYLSSSECLGICYVILVGGVLRDGQYIRNMYVHLRTCLKMGLAG
jgi:hypothetical protein